MGDRAKARMLTALGGLVMMAAAPATGQAATVTVGDTFTAPITANPIYGSTTTLFNRQLTPPLNATSPVDGTVISWRFIGNGAGSIVPRILRPVTATTYTGAGTGPGQVPAAGAAISGPFPLNLPINRGDYFGAVIPGGSGVAFTAAPGGTGTGASLTAPASDGGAPVTANDYPNEREAMGALVRYCLVPNLKGKRPADARKALAAADCLVGTTRKSKKRTKKKRVLSQTVAPGTSISDTAPVGFVRSRKRKG